MSLRHIVARGSGIIGLASIRTWFPENRKTVEFTSADRIGLDNTFTTSAFDYTADILKRLGNS
ncbi:MAG: hypothetical protein JST26_05855 [Bacteroidetes bacterium]|nr:hypothetical protein [Bacteroidota bacterium]